jgi:hypothetical protein
MEMAEALIDAAALGSVIGITIAVLEGRPKDEVELWGSRGTALGFLVGLFLVVCCPEEL